MKIRYVYGKDSEGYYVSTSIEDAAIFEIDNINNWFLIDYDTRKLDRHLCYYTNNIWPYLKLLDLTSVPIPEDDSIIVIEQIVNLDNYSNIINYIGTFPK